MNEREVSVYRVYSVSGNISMCICEMYVVYYIKKTLKSKYTVDVPEIKARSTLWRMKEHSCLTTVFTAFRFPFLQYRH
jgi:hypothetical protein